MTTATQRKKKELARKRRQIAQAAAQVFAREGFVQASMQSIAAEAGYAAPTLYNYFKNGKAEILELLLESVKEEYTGHFTIWLPEGMLLRQKMEVVLRQLTEWVVRNRAFLELLSNSTLMNQITEEHTPHAGVALTVGLWTDWFEAQDDLSELRGVPPREVAWLLWGLCHSLFVRFSVEEINESLPDHVPGLLDTLFHGLEGPPPAS